MQTLSSQRAGRAQLLRVVAVGLVAAVLVIGFTMTSLGLGSENPARLGVLPPPAAATH